MSEGMMQGLIDKIRKEHPTFTNKKGDTESYVYVVKNRETLIAVGRSNGDIEGALKGHLTDEKHDKSGIAMMTSAYNRTMNNIYYIPTSKKKGAEIDRELKKIEKNIKSIAQAHYEISDKNGGDTYCNGTSKNKDVSKLLKRFLYENLSAEAIDELNQPRFSFTELLDMVDEEGDAWDRIIKNPKSAKLACRLLGIKSRS